MPYFGAASLIKPCVLKAGIISKFKTVEFCKNAVRVALTSALTQSCKDENAGLKMFSRCAVDASFENLRHMFKNA